MAEENKTTTIQPEELVAMAVVADLLENQPEVVAAILAQHEIQPSTDPEENMLKICKLSAQRGRFFNEDFSKGAEVAGYHGAENVPHILANYVAKHSSLEPIQASYWSLKDLFKKKEGGTKVGNAIKNLFGKKPDTAVTPAVTAPEMADSPAAQELAKVAGDPKPDPKDPKQILGMSQVLFYSLLSGFILLIVIIIVIVIRRAKKKEAEKK